MGNDKIIHAYFSHMIYLISDANYLSNTSGFMDLHIINERKFFKSDLEKNCVQNFYRCES